MPTFFTPIERISSAGVLQSGSSQTKLTWSANRTFLGAWLVVGTAPIGSDIIVDVNIDGVTAYSTQANRPKIVDGDTSGTLAVPNTSSITTGQYLTIDIDQVGSGTAGSDLVVTLKFS